MEIEKNIILQLKEHDENFETVYMNGLSKIIDIYFAFKPKGISIARELLNWNAYNGLGKISNNIMKAEGVAFYHKKDKIFINVPIYFSNYWLSFIRDENPEKFHETFDINKIEIRNLSIERIAVQNPDKEIAEKILNLKNEEDMAKLDLENCFEIEFYFVILSRANSGPNKLSKDF